MTRQGFAWLDRALVKAAVAQAFAKLDPRVQVRNPVMFVVYVGSIVTTLLWIAALRGNVGPGSLRGLKKQTWAKKLEQPQVPPTRGGKWFPIEASNLRKGDVVYVLADDTIP